MIHLPGAANGLTKGGGRGPLPSAERFSDLLSALGIRTSCPSKTEGGVNTLSPSFVFLCASVAIFFFFDLFVSICVNSWFQTARSIKIGFQSDLWIPASAGMTTTNLRVSVPLWQIRLVIVSQFSGPCVKERIPEKPLTGMTESSASNTGTKKFLSKSRDCSNIFD